MPECDFCGCWTTDLRRLDNLELCRSCHRVARWWGDDPAGCGEADRPLICDECGHAVADHAAEMTEQAAGHVGCVGDPGKVAAVAPVERARRQGAQAD